MALYRRLHKCSSTVAPITGPAAEVRDGHDLEVLPRVPIEDIIRKGFDKRAADLWTKGTTGIGELPGKLDRLADGCGKHEP